MSSIISSAAINSRKSWISRLNELASTSFENASNIIESIISEEFNAGIAAISDHLRLCGDIPESFSHDSTEEKLYSKYTDTILSETFKFLGLRSIVLRERGDSADVECFADNFSFVADAKAFRLSRTAKNQKDFKIQALDGWKRGKPFAMVVCPIYQLPRNASQIYQQAIAKNVCVFTYSHLSVLARFASISTKKRSEELLHAIFNSISELNTSKDPNNYWMQINRTMLSFDDSIRALWQVEKQASLDSIVIAKEIALDFIAEERARVMSMSHEQAIVALIRLHKFESKIQTITSVTDSGILEI
jgi:hypothetical protein